MIFPTAIVLSAALSLAGRAAANTLDVTSKDAVGAAAKAAMKWMPYYYSTPNFDGAWDQSIIQWHESGEYWNNFLHYRKYSGDSTYDSFINTQFVIASWGNEGDFLNGNSGLQALEGKWNDDIAWWAFAAVTAAEIWGTSAVVDPTGPAPGRSWFIVAQNTLNEMMEQWDTTTCGGGVYWSRDRFSKSAAYKSTISNGQAIELAARLNALTPNATQVDFADKIYAWMKMYVITPDYHVGDGLDAKSNDNCSAEVNPTEWSYQPGVLIYGLAVLYNSTGKATYMSEAQMLTQTALAKFVDPASGALYEPTCGQFGGNFNCKDPAGYTWALFRGLAVMYQITTNTTLQAQIKTVVQTSATQMATRCTSADWNCIRTMNPVPSQYTYPNGTNPRDQIETMEILNSLALINGYTAKVEIQTAPVTIATASPSSGGGQAAPPAKSGASRGVAGATVIGTAFAAAFAALLAWA
ncbi:hydrolase 76 protein [Irineochytrium annulatum]|nr:hydrolase 76 protein [Irineochytrium annulatum]